MRKITDIYNEYKIMPNLQLHQLRVTAVAKSICESLDVEVDIETIIKACLLHDMGNIIKSKLGYFPEFEESNDLSYWERVKQEFIEKYGHSEHEATVKILQELGLPEPVIMLVNKNRFSNMCIDKDGQDINQKILHYADGRVGPHGILSYNDRMVDAGERYKNHKLSVHEEERQRLVDCGREIEKQIFSHSNIKPEDINDESVATNIESLKHFSI